MKHGDYLDEFIKSSLPLQLCDAAMEACMEATGRMPHVFLMSAEVMGHWKWEERGGVRMLMVFGIKCRIAPLLTGLSVAAK